MRPWKFRGTTVRVSDFKYAGLWKELDKQQKCLLPVFFNLNRYRPKSPGWISHEKQENNQTKSSHQRLRHNMMVKWIMLLECCVLLGNTSWCYFALCHPAQYHCRPQTVYWRWTCCRQLLSEVPLSWELFSKPASWFWICDSSYHFIWSR